MIKKVLITVKTYPNPSKNYNETVCTAGIDEDLNWIRLYPIPFRKKPLEQQYKKYEWIEVDIVKSEAAKDFRPESYRLRDIDSDIKVTGKIDSWDVRKHYLLNNVYDSISKLLSDSQEPSNKSLAVFKPEQIIRSYFTKTDREWTDAQRENMMQQHLFEANQTSPLRKLPYEFKYEFTDSEDHKCNLQILDWEIGALYWNCLRRYKGEEIACQKVLDKLNWMAENTDLHLILGTTLEHHQRRFLNPFTIIGLFYPPIDEQPTLF